ncbi:unnamed protein product [Adineta steineri]|uniref:Alpha-type protein kinase domain-containing protein n=1 Tax=Adineta steineri TaxID=433720 RepID=A0A814V891_9BILA|nr:unnamed protein product [Adineta steineri]CAF1183371.1 unnamed protein product [Adineta steineri]
MDKKSVVLPNTPSKLCDIAALRQQLDAIERNEKNNINGNISLEKIKKQCDMLQKETMDKLFLTTQKQLDAQKSKEFIIKRTKEIHEVMQAINNTELVDVCFLLDCTSSMQKYIDEVKDRILETVKLLKTRFSFLNIRLAFVGYRDLDLSEEEQFSILDFTDENEFYTFISTVVCKNGGDACEDVLGGLQRTINLNWQQPVRILIHIADGPSHGRRYHDLADVCDYYLTHDDNGAIGYRLIHELVELGVRYFFGRLAHHTDKMIEQFTTYTEGRMAIEQIDVGDFKNLLPFIVDTITHSISRATVSLLKNYPVLEENPPGTHNTSKISIQRSIVFEEKEPIWANIPPKQVKVIKYECNATLRCKEVIQSLTLKVADNPFAEGALRLAYYGSMLFKGQWGKFVLKEYKSVTNGENTKEKYLEMLDCQTVADYLAQEFNKLSPINNSTAMIKKIKFIMTKLVFMPQGGEGKFRYYTMERFIEGAYKKFSNNIGYVNYQDPALTLQAFSHWTYERTNGEMIVVDLQGIDIGDHQTYLLTDPCIHATDLKRFGRTNLGKAGMKRFFQTHVCNIICHALKLKRNKYQLDEAPIKWDSYFVNKWKSTLFTSVAKK